MLRQSTFSAQFALPRSIAFAGCCIIAALNARLAPIATLIEKMGMTNAFFSLFEISVVIWFALYAAWTLARSDEAISEPWQRGDAIVLTVLVLAILIPLPMPAIAAGFGAALWLLLSSQSGSPTRAIAIILTAITVQQIFGRLFMTMFSEYILAADIYLVDQISVLQGQGNVLTRTDGSEMIVAAGCSSINNLSYALLAWVTVSQLFKMAVTRQLLAYVALTMVIIFLLNSLRLLMMGWYPEHFDFLHGASGAAIFGWSGFLLLAAIAGIAVLHLAPRQQHL